VSEENAETLRLALDAFNRRNKAAWLATCDPELENVPASEWPENARIRGAEAIWDFYVEAVEAWEALVRRLLWPRGDPGRPARGGDRRSARRPSRGRQVPRGHPAGTALEEAWVAVGAGPVSLAFLLGL
jgi:hypothetical protein